MPYCQVQLYPFVYGYPVVPASFVLKSYYFPYELFWHLCQKWINHKCKGLLLDSQLHSIGLYAGAWISTTLPWLLWLCSELWNLYLLVLQLCSFSRSLWLFCDLLSIIWNLLLACQFQRENNFKIWITIALKL